MVIVRGGGVSLRLSYIDGGSWQNRVRFAPHPDTLKFNQLLADLWRSRPVEAASILKVGVTLFDLTDQSQLTRDLFDAENEHEGLNIVLDQINQRYGANTLYFGGAHHGLGAAPMRIAFSHVPELAVESDG